MAGDRVAGHLGGGRDVFEADADSTEAVDIA